MKQRIIKIHSICAADGWYYQAPDKPVGTHEPIACFALTTTVTRLEQSDHDLVQTGILPVSANNLSLFYEEAEYEEISDGDLVRKPF